jgi:hypothetical protein
MLKPEQISFRCAEFDCLSHDTVLAESSSLLDPRANTFAG